MGKKTYKLVRILDAGRVILGDKRALGKDKEFYEKLLESLKTDWKRRYMTSSEEKRSIGFCSGQHVLVKSEKYSGPRRALVLEVNSGRNPLSERCYSVYLYDEGDFEDIDDTHVAALSGDRAEQMEPQTVIVRLLGIVPVKIVLDGAKVAELNASSEDGSVVTQVSSWSNRANRKVKEWLQHPDLRYLGIQTVKTNFDGSVYGDVYRKLHSRAYGVSQTNIDVSPERTKHKEKQFLSEFIIEENLGKRVDELEESQLKIRSQVSETKDKSPYQTGSFDENSLYSTKQDLERRSSYAVHSKSSYMFADNTTELEESQLKIRSQVSETKDKSPYQTGSFDENSLYSTKQDLERRSSYAAHSKSSYMFADNTTAANSQTNSEEFDATSDSFDVFNSQSSTEESVADRHSSTVFNEEESEDGKTETWENALTIASSISASSSSDNEASYCDDALPKSKLINTGVNFGRSQYIDMPGRLLVRGRLLRSPYTKIKDFMLAKPISETLEVLKIEISEFHKIVAPHFIRGSDMILIAPDGASQKGKNSRALSYVIPILRLVYESYSKMTSGDDNAPPETLIVVNSHNTGSGLESYINQLLGRCQELPLRIKFLTKDTFVDRKNYNRRHIPGGDSVLIITMAYLESVMQTKDGPFLFKGLRFLIFEELDIYLKTHRESILTFIDAARENVYVSSKSLPLQITFSGAKWSVDMENLFKEVVQDRPPVLVISAPAQALRYAKLEWKVHLVPREYSRMETLIDLLKSQDFEVQNHLRVAISCSTPEVATSVYEAVRIRTEFQTHLVTVDCDLNSFLSIQRLWNKNCHNVMVVSDEMIDKFPVSNATCLINFDSPVIPDHSIAAKRFAFLWNNIRNLEVEQYLTSNQTTSEKPLQSQRLTTHFLLTGQEHNFYKVYKFVSSLGNTVVDFPVELKQRAESIERDGFQQVPLCNGFRLFGFCDQYDPQDCPARHGFKREELEDTSALPLTGELEVRIISCKNPSLYQVQLRRHYEYDEEQKRVMKFSYLEEVHRRKSELMKYYTSRKRNSNAEDEDDLSLQCFKEGTWCGVQVQHIDDCEDYFARAKVQCVLQRDKFGSPTILRVLCVDSGQSMNPSAKRLYKLPKKFQGWHPLIVDLVLCDLKPKRDEKEYRTSDIRRADKLTTGKVLTAKIWLAIGNTVWVNPMVEYRTDPVTKKVYKGDSTRLVLISEQLAEGNGNHLKTLMYLVNKHAGVYRGLTSISNEIFETWDGFGQINKEFHQLGDEIQWAFVPKTCNNTIQQTRIVTQFGYDPWLVFGVHEKFYEQLKSLENDLNNCIEEYINKRFAQCRDMFKKHYKPGMVVAAKERVEQTWMRGLIMNQHEGEEERLFKVFFVDYGDICTNMTVEELFPMPTNMVTHLPFQAIAFKLNHITPLGGCDAEWNQKAKDAFLDVIIPDSFSIDVDVVAFSDEEYTFSEFPLRLRFYNAVVLYEGEDLGMTLVQKGLAAWTPGMESLVQETKDKLLEYYNAAVDQAMGAINVDEDGDENDNYQAEISDQGDFDMYFDGNVEELGIKLNGLNKLCPDLSFYHSALNTPPIHSAIEAAHEEEPTPSTSQVQQPQLSSQPESPSQSLVPPVLRTDLLYPRVVWRQTEFSLVLTVHLADIKEYELKLLDDKNTIQFKTLDKNPNYEFTMKVFGKLQPDFSTNLTGQYMRITFSKRLANTTWPRVLFHKDHKYLWLKQDMDYDSDPEEHVTEWETLRNRYKEQSLASTSTIPTNGYAQDDEDSDLSENNGLDDDFEMLLEDFSNDEY